MECVCEGGGSSAPIRGMPKNDSKKSKQLKKKKKRLDKHGKKDAVTRQERVQYEKVKPAVGSRDTCREVVLRQAVAILLRKAIERRIQVV